MIRASTCCPERGIRTRWATGKSYRVRVPAQCWRDCLRECCVEQNRGQRLSARPTSIGAPRHQALGVPALPRRAHTIGGSCPSFPSNWPNCPTAANVEDVVSRVRGATGSDSHPIVRPADRPTQQSRAAEARTSAEICWIKSRGFRPLVRRRSGQGRHAETYWESQQSEHRAGGGGMSPRADVGAPTPSTFAIYALTKPNTPSATHAGLAPTPTALARNRSPRAFVNHDSLDSQ